MNRLNLIKVALRACAKQKQCVPRNAFLQRRFKNGKNRCQAAPPGNKHERRIVRTQPEIAPWAANFQRLANT